MHQKIYALLWLPAASAGSLQLLHSPLQQGSWKKLRDTAGTTPVITHAVEVPGPVPLPEGSTHSHVLSRWLSMWMLLRDTRKDKWFFEQSLTIKV